MISVYDNMRHLCLYRIVTKLFIELCDRETEFGRNIRILQWLSIKPTGNNMKISLCPMFERLQIL